MIPKDAPPWVRTLAAVLAVLLLLYVFVQMLAGLTPFLAAFAIAYFLNPSLNRFESRLTPLLGRLPWVGRKVDPRALAVLLTLSSVAAIVVVILLFAVPELISQVDACRAQPAPDG